MCFLMSQFSNGQEVDGVEAHVLKGGGGGVTRPLQPA